MCELLQIALKYRKSIFLCLTVLQNNNCDGKFTEWLHQVLLAQMVLTWRNHLPALFQAVRNDTKMSMGSNITQKTDTSMMEGEILIMQIQLNNSYYVLL